MILINGITQGTQRTFVKRFLLDVIDVTKLRYMVYNEKSNWLVIVARQDESILLKPTTRPGHLSLLEAL